MPAITGPHAEAPRALVGELGGTWLPDAPRFADFLRPCGSPTKDTAVRPRL
ncbi:hypothetical protein ACFFX1_12045 [Dactylosporangium sucinum]|uniref:Uncharacterized protein n=1 Tax=Dactylosporangium sucinum TaxID=1424081 RepID=A0A917TL07_9ACTN|nr:hypothetical protein [Dactylosporangium sucinum]GGM27428.1 hypothetical protein GCM10007977_030800 [Dactylosporangium sucinum]